MDSFVGGEGEQNASAGIKSLPQNIAADRGYFFAFILGLTSGGMGQA